ncbi:DUF1501 domain-containing protein [Lignipirellula cremea]|uniref:Sulfatase n=1 Tax=Lignipirellula cremea TaxID=2528010 RepID=A0A518DPB6_9BACT|nr:DUF1501 domain-containing protein [Lignipirellula cremea]QDU93681.1 hypothetical protein Pla8534_14620 [Lignipirellula cremea]
MERLTERATMMPSHLSRRELLHSAGGGLSALALSNVLAGSAQAEQAPHFRPRAKRVIHLFMNGGPYQGDFFDPKPELARHEGERLSDVEFRTERATKGLMPSPFKFAPQGESGIQVSELLPEISKHIDDICVLRSLHTNNPNHGPALLLMNNGTIVPTRPSMGAWFLYGLGSQNEDLPGYVVFCPGKPVRFSILWNSAFLPSEYQGVYINHSNLDPKKMLPFLENSRLPLDRQRAQVDLLQQLNQQHLAERSDDPLLASRMRSMETAWRMQTAASDAFDISQETKQTRDDYGTGHFANACLLSRRLVERGLRFVQVYYGNGQPWDTHSKHNDTVKRLAADSDGPIAALLADLKQRGLLEDTLVIWGGEFGRTPTSENGTGRDHNHYGFTMWMAGGGVKGGMTYGETDDFGFRAVENKVHIHDLHATILHLLGLDHERLTYRYAGRNFRLTDVHGRVVKEILA